MLLPRQGHGRPIDGEVGVAHHGAVLHLRTAAAAGAPRGAGDLLDQQLDVRPGPPVMQDPDVFQAHQGRHDLIRLGQDEGAKASSSVPSSGCTITTTKLGLVSFP